MEASEAPPARPAARRGASGGAGIVAGLLLVGLLLMGLAMAISFAINAQHEAELEAAQREEHAKRVEAEQQQAAAEARAAAEHERAVAAEKARAEHEARQVAALHAEEVARAREAGDQGSGATPPELAVGRRVVVVQGANTTAGSILAISGSWVQVKTRSGTKIWLNFLRVDRYEVVPA